MAKILQLFVREEQEIYCVNNPHDKLFKDLLDDADELKRFVKEYIGINILDEELEKSNTEYITDQYKMYKSDMVYKIKQRNVYILIEHQSTVDKNMPYRMLNYCNRKLKEIENQKGGIFEKYPLIIPIVLYTGDRKWNVEKKYSKKVEKYGTNKNYIELQYELIDINQYTEEELLKKNTILSYAMLIEKNRGKESLIKVLEKISKNCDTNCKKEKMQKIINYILQPILQEDTEKMIKKFKKDKEELDMKTAQDYIREEIRELKRKAIEEGRAEGIKKGMKEGKKEGIKEGRREGRKEGREKGKTEGISYVIINMLRNKVELDKIKEYTGMDEKEIQKIAANM